MLKPIILASILLFNSLLTRAQLIDDFDDNTLTNWYQQSCYTLAETNQELAVTATNAFNYQVFHKQSINENFSSTKLLYLKVKTSSPVTLRVDLGDVSGVTTNASAISFLPTADGLYHVYTLDFNNRFRQSFPSSALVDSTAITQVILFLNPAGPAFTGNVFIDSIGHKPDLVTLPVHFISFSGQLTTNKVNLTFKVAEETDVERYIIQRSTSGLQWQSIGEQTPINIGGNAQYTFTDLTPADGNNIYRIAILKNSGNIIYSILWQSQNRNNLYKTKLIHSSQGQYQLVFTIITPDPPLFADTYTFTGQFLKKIKLIPGLQTLTININTGSFVVITHQSSKKEIFKLNYY